MSIEIERKFLLKSDLWRGAILKSTPMIQGYFAGSSESPTMRIRIAGELAFLTVKGRPGNFSRSEFEYGIPPADARAMLTEFCASRMVEKVRHIVEYAGKRWEIDEYGGAFRGLFTAEIELRSEDETFEAPPWLGPEISHVPGFTNGSLARTQKIPPLPDGVYRGNCH